MKLITKTVSTYTAVSNTDTVCLLFCTRNDDFYLMFSVMESTVTDVQAAGCYCFLKEVIFLHITVFLYLKFVLLLSTILFVPKIYERQCSIIALRLGS